MTKRTVNKYKYQLLDTFRKADHKTNILLIMTAVGIIVAMSI